MKTNAARFNFYLALVMLLVLAGGCQYWRDRKDRRDATLIELHLEVNSDGTRDNGPVSIYRESPVVLNVDDTPFLDGADVDEATVIGSSNSLFSIRLKFNWRGTGMLETITSSNPHKRIAVFASFGQSRWLAAPLIQGRISDGVLTFTPDATYEETDRIVSGLNKVAKQIKKNDKL